MSIRTLKTIRQTIPLLIAGWPGMGNVGLGAVSYLRRHLKAEPCAALDLTSFIFPDSIEVTDGIGRTAAPPAQNIYLVEEPPALVFEGSLQAGGEPGLRIANELLDYAQEHGVRTVYTGAAFAAAMSHRDEVRVHGVSTNDQLKQAFANHGVEPLASGRISGLNGLLLGLAGSRGLSGACFLATMPHYAVQTPNPKASRALIRVFEQILNVTVDHAEIDAEVDRVDQMLGEFESRVNAAIEHMRETMDADSDRAADDEDMERPEPHEIMRRVEQLFEEVEQDRSRAPQLKQELDRWGLFHVYEDRFLDLFDRRHRRD